MENAALLQALVHNAIDGIITIDASGIVESINPAACKLFAYQEHEVVGKNISMLMPSTDRENHDGYLHTYKKTGKPHIIGIGRELTGRTKDGYHFPFKLGVSEVKYAGRTIYAGSIHDLTQQKADEVRLKNYASHLEELVEERTKTLNDAIKAIEKSKEKVSASLEKEKELSKLKNRFLSMASHEFRTPLSTVHLSASLIEKYAEPYQDEKIAKHVGKIIKSVTNLTSVLNDFLYMEQLEGGKVEANPTHFDIVFLATEITEEMQLLAKESQQINYTHTGIQNQVFLDQNLLKNCIVNLITNAIKYSGDICCIEFTTKIDETHCIITVKDNGIGIPEDDQQHLFQPFFRAHNTGNIAGTGLGLNIVERYLSLMKGKVSFSSTTTEGTLFTLTFKL
ncbi:PAS domain S-box-containing protein [Flavobacterium arsenatis]|uniref:histidine kinase n=1 Tax=Flavobacterium arsenatis TaxID=1484332 RepID=A0ABU1TTT0_9FLAO|nr:PAS domain-containing sensor histidine kinase [Flavobacterium arsenatis]MDR6969282.1 PAS domain S-box-containing protein [Flavobacterium arsenatis]